MDRGEQQGGGGASVPPHTQTVLSEHRVARGTSQVEPYAGTLAAGSAPPNPGSLPHDQTLAAGSAPPDPASIPHDRTLAPSDAQAQPVIIRAGGKDDYRALVPVDPQHYVVGREIARGGMGRISVARDRRLGRSVALKELLVASPEMRARFEREARITAKLQHPSIVNLLEAGTWPHGEPFYVMKLVSGESLDKVIAARPTLAGRLALLPNVIAVADALAYAHAARVIHRDLKPANVLVGAYGETVVIDWGLAKDLSDAADVDDVSVGPVRAPVAADSTQIGAVLGTPAYMPIEQADGKPVDERADVYALGAMLYHLLAGVPPYTGRSADAVLDAVLAGPPRPIETCAREAPRDLLAIVHKAMARSAADRYPTAQQLVEDLKRFQTGQLVAAHQYSSWQLVGRWLRRHRTAVAVAGVAAVVLGVLGVVSLRAIFAEQSKTEAQRVLAVQKGQDAEDLIGFMMGDLKDKLEPVGKIDLLDAAAKKAMAYYDRKGERLSAADRRKRAIAHQDLGDVLLAQGHTDQALSQYRAALTHALIASVSLPGDRDAFMTVANSHFDIAMALAEKDPQAGLAELETALSLADSIAALPDADWTWTQLRAQIRERLGNAYWKTDAARALAEYESALQTYEALAAKHPNEQGLRRTVANCHAAIARILSTRGETAKALEHARAALASDEALAASDPDNPAVLRALATDHSELAPLLESTGDAKAAGAEFRAALAMSKRVADRDPQNAKAQDDLATSHGALGTWLETHRDLTGALAEYEAAFEIGQRVLALEPWNEAKQQALSVTRFRIGELHREKGNLDGALTELEAFLQMSEQLAAKAPTDGDRQRNVAVGNMYVGDVLNEREDFAGALKRYRTAVAIFEKRVALDPTNVDRKWDLGDTKQRVGDVLLQLGDYPGALAQYTAVRQLREELTAEASARLTWRAELATTCVKQADAHDAMREPLPALANMKEALAILRELTAKLPNHDGIRANEQVIADEVAKRERAVRNHKAARSKSARR